MRFFDWLIKEYEWCHSCQQRVANTGHELCARCQAKFDLDLNELLKDK